MIYGMHIPLHFSTIWGTYHVLTIVISEETEICSLKSAMRKKVLSYSKTRPAPVWMDSENYSSTFFKSP